MISLRYHLVRGSQTTYTVGHPNQNRGPRTSPRRFVSQPRNSTHCPRQLSPRERAGGLLLSALPSVRVSKEQRQNLIQPWTAHPVVDCRSSSGIGRGSCGTGAAEQQVPSRILAQYWEFWITSVPKPRGTCQQCQLTFLPTATLRFGFYYQTLLLKLSQE